MKMPIITSVIVIALIAVGLGMGTMAYFSDDPQATGNAFTAGDLNVKLWDGSNWVDDIEGFWDVDNWAPGDTFTRRLAFKNFGTVDAKVMLLDFNNYAGTPYSFWNVIEVNIFYEYLSPDGGGYFNCAPLFATGYEWGDEEEPLTLHELIIGLPDGTTRQLDDYELLFFDTVRADSNANGENEFGGAYLAAGAQGFIEIGFKFSEDAGNGYQNADCSFDLELLFLQGPEWMDKADLPGYVSP